MACLSFVNANDLYRAARQEALFGLDFVSLLLSKDLPEQGKSSMSPVLKTSVPIASLGFDRWDMNHTGAADSITAESARKELSVARGRRLLTISSAVKSLRASGERLEDEIDREQVYWNDVTSIRQAGWRVRRMVPERSVLAVQAGSLEANPQFRARGLTVLQRKEDGHVQLEGFSDHPPSQIRTRLIRNGVVVGTSLVPPLPSDSTPRVGLEDEILKMRDSLFDEELFHEIGLEAREMFLYGINLKDGSVSFSTAHSSPANDSNPPPNSYDVIIDLVPLDNDTSPPQQTASGESNPTLPLDQQARTLNLLFRLLMSRTYTRRLLRRTRLPDPIGDNRRPPLTTSILGPLIDRLYSLKSAGSSWPVPASALS